MLYAKEYKPIYDYGRLKGRIYEKFESYTVFAKVLGKSRQYVSKIIRCNSYLSVDELETWRQLLEIDVDEIAEYFFTLKTNET